MVSPPHPSWKETGPKWKINQQPLSRVTLMGRESCGGMESSSKATWLTTGSSALPAAPLDAVPLPDFHFSSDPWALFISPNSQQLSVFMILELLAGSTASKGSSELAGAIGKSLMPSHGVGRALSSTCRALRTRSRRRDKVLPHVQPWQLSSAGRTL